MRKILAFSVGIGVGLYVINKVVISKGIDCPKDARASSIDKAGFPELDNIENAKMVDEGSQFGVEYYNHLKAGE